MSRLLYDPRLLFATHLPQYVVLSTRRVTNSALTFYEASQRFLLGMRTSFIILDGCDSCLVTTHVRWR